jgi:enamine deaminase RidA (YjgF/YER057c/UK114 family)
MAAQLELPSTNLEAVLATADMTVANIVRLDMYTTDVDELFKNNAVITDRFGNSRYATIVLGVAQLPAQLLVMLEATAVD